ncbi:hypothetical protein FOZ60_006674 [Perkinsus olseni]|uniref:RING-type domain-containing protein n=1 Tax=Perkinsus olseni TaxID=32597 RepID=A0A7J6NNK2_PEROL|nr:hypothetical protein FOZ60_006674 [Perkinsus olseni]
MAIDLTINEGTQNRRDSADSTAAVSAVIVCSKCKGQLRSDITGRPSRLDAFCSERSNLADSLLWCGLRRCGHLFHARCASSVHERCPKCNKPVKDVETDYLSFYITFGHHDSDAVTATSQDEETELRQSALEAYAKKKQLKADRQSHLSNIRKGEQRNQELHDRLARVASECSRIEREHARDEAKLDEMSRTISRNIERTTGAAKLIDNLECQRIVQTAWKQTADAFAEASQDDVIAMAVAHRATKDMLQSIRNAALANDKDRVERVVGFVLSAVDDRRTEERETHRRVQEKRRAIQCKMEELQQLRSKNARDSHKARARVDEVGGRQSKRVKKSLHPIGKGASLARAKKQKIIDLDEDGLEAIPGLCNPEIIDCACGVIDSIK